MVSKFIKLIEVKWIQNSNILLVFVTNDTLNFDISNSGINWQLLNIFSIFVTFEVSKLEISNDIKLRHNSNILCMLVTKEVLNFDISNVFISLQS